MTLVVVTTVEVFTGVVGTFLLVVVGGTEADNTTLFTTWLNYTTVLLT